MVEYLGRCTHRIAISNNRLVKLEDGKVTFRWKDYKRKNRSGLMTLDADEFIRSFLIHVLPRGFMRLRHMAFLPTAIVRRNLRNAGCCSDNPNSPTLQGRN